MRTTDIDSLTNFQRHAKDFVRRLEESQLPMVLTVNGKARLVVQDAGAYQAIVDELTRARFIAAVHAGLKEAELGQGRPTEEVFAELRARHAT